MVMRNTLRNSNITLSMEAIAFQTKAFGGTLEAIIQEIRDSGITSSKSLEEAGFGKLILNAIKEHTNIELEAVIFKDGYDNMSVGTRIQSINHIFDAASNWKYSMKSETAEKIFDNISKTKAKSYIDLATGKVYGYFQKIGVDIHIGMPMLLDQKKSSAGIAAYILHEIGHIIAYCEFYNRISTTNQVLAAVARSIEKESPEKMKLIFTTAAKALDIAPKTFEGLEDVKDPAVVCTVVIDAALHNVPQINSGIYDQVTKEQMADNYVARQGYGRALLEMVDFTSDPTYGTPDLTTGQSVVALGTMFVGLVCAAVPVITTSAAAAVAIMYCYFNIMNGGCRTYSYTYDTVKVRMKRIREQIVESIKDPSISAAQKKAILTDLDRADMLLANKTDAKEGLFDKIANFTRKTNKNLKDSITLQRDLEELSANDLFVKAAKLGTI